MLNNLNEFNKLPFGSGTANFGMTLQSSNAQPTPSMQADINAAAIKQAAGDNYIANRVNAFSEVDPLLQAGIAVPVWAAINQGMDRYLKYCGGDYSKFIPGRIGNFGDKISNFFTQNSAAKGINKQLNKIGRFFKRNVYDKSGVIRAFARTPSKAELPIAVQQAEGLKGMILHDNSFLDSFINPVKSAKDLDTLGASKADITRIENLLKKAGTAQEKQLILQAEELKLLDPTLSEKTIRAFKYNASPEKRAEILKNLKIKALGFDDVAQFTKIKENPLKYADEFQNALSKSKKNIFVKVDYSDKNLFSKVNGELFGRKINLSEIFNKLQSSKGLANTMHSSKLGRTLSKWSGMIMEGATSRISGGKIAAMMQAYFVAEALIMANKQESTGDKFKSFAERMTELVGFFVFMPPAIQLMHKIGGLQYSGMTKEQIELYRNAVKEFNEKVVNCAFANKKEYKAAKKVLRSQFRPKTKNPFVYMARKAADIITVGLEQIRPYTKHKQKQVNLCITEILKNPLQYIKNIGPRLKDFACNPKYWLKQMAGYPMRFALPMLVFIPFFNKIAVKACHAVVGKPKYSILDKEKFEKEQEEQAAKAAQMAAAQQATSQVSGTTAPPSQSSNLLDKYKTAQMTSSTSGGNLLDKYKKQQAQTKPAQISSTGQVKPEEKKEEKTEKVTQPEGHQTIHKYIPSPEGVKIVEKKQNLSEVDAALKRADIAEKMAIKELG